MKDLFKPEEKLPVEFYKAQNEMMAARYAISAAKLRLGIDWVEYFDKAKVFLRDDDYKIWVFLCGVEETFKEAAQIKILNKKHAKKYIEKRTEKRLYKIRGKDDLDLYLKNM